MAERMAERTRPDRRNPANRLKIPDLMAERTPENFFEKFYEKVLTMFG